MEAHIFGCKFGRKPFCAWGVARTDLALTEFPKDWKTLQLLLFADGGFHQWGYPQMDGL